MYRKISRKNPNKSPHKCKKSATTSNFGWKKPQSCPRKRQTAFANFFLGNAPWDISIPEGHGWENRSLAPAIFCSIPETRCRWASGPCLLRRKVGFKHASFLFQSGFFRRFAKNPKLTTIKKGLNPCKLQNRFLTVISLCTYPYAVMLDFGP